MHERQKHILRKVCLRHTDEVTTEACNYHEHPCFNIIFVSFMYPWKWIESWLSNFPIFFLDLSVCFYFHIRKNGFRSPSLEACTSHTMPMSQHFYRLSIFRLLFPQSRLQSEEGLVGCFASFSLGVSGNKAYKIKNGCLRNSNESPHFSRPNLIERRTL